MYFSLCKCFHEQDFSKIKSPAGSSSESPLSTTKLSVDTGILELSDEEPLVQAAKQQKTLIPPEELSVPEGLPSNFQLLQNFGHEQGHSNPKCKCIHAYLWKARNIYI